MVSATASNRGKSGDGRNYGSRPGLSVGLTAHFISSFTVPEMDFTMRITGSHGEAFAHNFCVAAIDDRIDVTVDGQTRTEEMGKSPLTPTNSRRSLTTSGTTHRYIPMRRTLSCKRNSSIRSMRRRVALASHFHNLISHRTSGMTSGLPWSHDRIS